MNKLIKNYLESYWWYFMGQAIVAIVFGVVALLAPITTMRAFVLILVIALILMGSVGVARMVKDYEKKPHRRWGDSLVIALVELILGLYFLIHLNAGFQLTALVLGFVVLARGIFDLIVGLWNVKDSTDKFFWITAGVAGIIIGIVILNHPLEASITMIWFFALYALVLGLSHLFYALHLRSILTTKSATRVSAKSTRPKKTTKKAAAKK